MDSNHKAFEENNPTGKLVSLNDYQLWREFKAGDVAAYSLIYRKYFFALYSFGKKISLDHDLVKDCIQDLFMKIWNNRENLGDTTSVRYYLMTSLKHKILDAMESTNRRYLSRSEPIDIEISSPQEENDLYGQKEKVYNAMSKLSKHQQHILQKKFFENQSNKEIASDLNITVQSVYNLVFKSLRSLKKQLGMIALLFLSFF